MKRGGDLALKLSNFIASFLRQKKISNAIAVQTHHSIRTTLTISLANGTLDASLYDAELTYFRNHYFSNGALTDHFPNLHLRASDHPTLVLAVIEGFQDGARDRMISAADDRLATS